MLTLVVVDPPIGEVFKGAEVHANTSALTTPQGPG